MKRRRARGTRAVVSLRHSGPRHRANVMRHTDVADRASRTDHSLHRLLCPDGFDDGVSGDAVGHSLMRSTPSLTAGPVVATGFRASSFRCERIDLNVPTHRSPRCAVPEKVCVMHGHYLLQHDRTSFVVKRTFESEVGRRAKTVSPKVAAPMSVPPSQSNADPQPASYNVHATRPAHAMR